MKTQVVTVVAILITGPALAADLPSRNPPALPPPPIFTWAGFYVGVEAGYAWAHDAGTEYSAATGVRDGFTANSNPSGWTAGGLAGYNWQYGSVVFGLEGDIEGAGVKGSGNYSLNGAPAITDHVVSDTNLQASIRGRLGYAIDRVLLYGTGGAAFANTDFTYVRGVSGPPSTSFSDSRVGWTAGAGAEYAFTNNWTVRVEYRYADFGSVTNSSVVFSGPVRNEKQHLTENTIRLGVAYKF